VRWLVALAALGMLLFNSVINPQVPATSYHLVGFFNPMAVHLLAVNGIRPYPIEKKLRDESTAIRFAEITDAAVAVIMSTGNKIDYCFLSEAMKSLPKLDWLRKGSPLPPGTATARLAERPERVLASNRVADDVDVRDWLGGTRSAPVTAESIGLGQYGKVLTILVSSSEPRGISPYLPDNLKGARPRSFRRNIDFVVAALREYNDFPLASYQRKFIVDQVRAACKFEGIPPQFRPELITMALNNLYTKDTPDHGVANGSVN
jgi:hypothetical protein